ncbi:hypothetical protein [Deinococcus sp. YIM 77859]|uniref:hypothetical protein n=1 Tax=Deinococcus sp. YIM 77859 TaxID=1540221 RepID=UPI000557DA36|nr:hypothetical protein [Deinococcus sp. YIM 77859]
MSDFDALQAALRRSAGERQAEGRACEAFLNALYHALRTASGPGLPLNNVTLDLVLDPAARLRPPPLGGWHAAWLRLGLCEVLVRVRREAGAFVGEYGQKGTFHLADVTEDALTLLARHLLRDLAATYAGGNAAAWPDAPPN